MLAVLQAVLPASQIVPADLRQVQMRNACAIPFIAARRTKIIGAANLSQRQPNGKSAWSTAEALMNFIVEEITEAGA